MGLIEDALARQDANAVLGGQRQIDYDRMNKVFPSQKAALTRAIKTGDAERIAQVCKDAVQVWDEIGAWPDDWGRWQSALDDALPWHQHIDISEL